MAESDSIPYLKRLSDNREYPLVGSSMVIGRRDTCEIVLSDESGVSRQHAVITVVEGDFTIEDLGSTNGVLLNGEKITAPTKIITDDTLIFDILEYQLNASGAAQEQAAPLVETPVVSGESPAIKQSKDKDHSPPKVAPVDEGKQTRGPSSRKAAWIEERHAGATMFMPAAESSIDTGQIAPVEYSGDEPALIVIEGGDVGYTIKLTSEKNIWRIGSSVSQDIVLSKEGVSESHATLSRDGSKWELRDLLSQNGIRVNGNKTLHSYLSNEDVIRFGPTKCLFVIPKGYKNPTKPIAANPKSRVFLKSFALLFFLVVAALIAASYFELLDFQSVLSVIKGR